MNTVMILGKLANYMKKGYVLKVRYNNKYPKWTATLDGPNGHIIHSDHGPIRALEGLTKRADRIIR